MDDNWVDHPKWVDRLAKILYPLSYAIKAVLNFIDPQINYVKIDYWDTWSMDCTLADIILPMLKQLKATKHGAAFVDDEDVPENIRSTNSKEQEVVDIDEFFFARWEYVLDEMIWAFETKVKDDFEDNFFEIDTRKANGFRLFGKYFESLWD